MAILGCGTLGTAILCGILDALSSTPNDDNSEPIPELVPRRFTALVTTTPSAARISSALALCGLATQDAVAVETTAHAAAVAQASMVLLGCKPHLAASILSTAEIYAALSGKLLVSICAGVTLDQLEALVPKSCRVVRVMPNTAARIRKSMTAISASARVLPQELAAVRWICAGIGRTVVLDEKHMDAATAICGSGPAFAALVLEAMTDGGVLVGVPRPQAQDMVAQVMLGAAAMVLEGGQSPSLIREQICTPGGCTISGLMYLEDQAVRSTMARAVECATEVASGLGANK